MHEPTPTRPVAAFAPHNRDLVEQLRDDDPAARLDALAEVGELDDETAGELLRLLAADPDERVRAAAAIALGPTLEICSAELDDHGRLATGDDPELGPPLTQAAFERVTAALRDLYHDPTAPEVVRRRALEAAVRCPAPWQVGAIRAAAASADGGWQLTAIFAMGFCTEADFAGEIERALRGPSVELRREALLAAGQRGLDHLRPEVIAVASDRQAPPALRCAAVESLGSLGDEDTVELLQSLAEARDADLRAAAEEALARLELALVVDLDDDGEWDEDEDER